MAERCSKRVENTVEKGEIARYERLVLQTRKTPLNIPWVMGAIKSLRYIWWINIHQIDTLPEVHRVRIFQNRS